MTVGYTGNNQSLAGGSTMVSTWPAGSSGNLAAQVVDYQFSSLALVAETTGYGTPSASTTYFDPDATSLVPTLVQNGNTDQSLYTLASTAQPLNTGDVVLATDGAGNTTEYQYNADNQVWCQVSPAEYADGVTCPSTPPSSPPSPGSADPNLGATISFYNSSGQLTAQTDALGNTTTYKYTSGVSGVPDGLQYCSVGPVAYQASFTCPAYAATHVAGTTTASFDSAGDMTSSTDADGNTTTYAYGISAHPGLVSSKTSPDGTTTSYTYNSAGQVTVQTETVSFGSYSATTHYAYDTAGDQYCEVAPVRGGQRRHLPLIATRSPPTPATTPTSARPSPPTTAMDGPYR